MGRRIRAVAVGGASAKSSRSARNASITSSPPAARASRPSKRGVPPGFSQSAARSSRLRLELGIVGDDLRPGAIEHFGMAAKRPGRRARRVEQDRIELRGRASTPARRRRPVRPSRRVRSRFSRSRPRRLSDESTAVTRGPRPRAASSCRRAPRKGRARPSHPSGMRRAGSDAARSCTHQRPLRRSPASSATDELSRRTWLGASDTPPCSAA